MVTAVASTTGASSAASASSADVFGGMGSDTFLKLLVAQMKYQNPMSPSDPTAMLGQIATYAQVEALNKLQGLQASGNSLAETQIATSLVGQDVTAMDSTGAPVTGKVTAARFTDAGPILVLDTGAELSLSSIARIGTAAAPGATTPATTTPATTTPATTTPATTTPATTTPATTTPATTTPAATAPAATAPAATAPAATDPTATS
jgi:flagellar basal-body rod modification protein FlgD